MATENLRPADLDERQHTLAFALRYDGRREHRRADEMMARLMAAHLANHLAAAGYVVMKRPPVPHHGVVYGPGGKSAGSGE